MRLTNSYSERISFYIVLYFISSNYKMTIKIAIMLMLFMKMVKILTIYKEAQKGQSCEKA